MLHHSIPVSSLPKSSIHCIAGTLLHRTHDIQVQNKCYTHRPQYMLICRAKSILYLPMMYGHLKSGLTSSRPTMTSSESLILFCEMWTSVWQMPVKWVCDTGQWKYVIVGYCLYYTAMLCMANNNTSLINWNMLHFGSKNIILIDENRFVLDRFQHVM